MLTGLPISDEVERGSKAGKLGRSSKQKRPPLSADLAVPGKLLQPARTAISGDLGATGRHIRVVEGVGCAGMPPDTAVPAMPDNASHRNSARILTDVATQVFDQMTVRDPNTNPGLHVPVEEGQVWEKGPEVVVRDGTSIHAIFSPSTSSSARNLPGAGNAEPMSPANPNAGHTQRPGMSRGPLDAVDTRDEGYGGCGHAPDLAMGAGGQLDANRRSLQPDSAADFLQLHGGSISSSVGLHSSSKTLRQAPNGDFLSARAGREGGLGRASASGANQAQFWAQYGTNSLDFGQVGAAPVSSSNFQRPIEHGMVLEGSLGSVLGVLRGNEMHRQHNAASGNGTTLHCVPEDGAILEAPAGGLVSAWGHSPNYTY